MSSTTEKNKSRIRTSGTEKPEKKEEFPTDLSVGEILRRARVSSKQSLADVEAAIRIRASMLEHIELMELDKMPGWIYTIGFIRTYSEYLDLDGDKMIALLKSQTGGKKRQELHFPVVAKESSLPSPWVIMMAGVGLLVVIALAFIVNSLSFSSSPSSFLDVNAIPPLPMEQVVEERGERPPRQEVESVQSPSPEDAADADKVSEDDPEFIQGRAPRDENGIILPQLKPDVSERVSSEASEKQQYSVIIDVIEESWIEIRDTNDEILVSRVLKAGDQYYVPDNATGYTMTTGNIAGIEVSVDGRALSINGNEGEVKRNIPLDAQSLKEMFP